MMALAPETQIVALDCPRCGATLAVEVERDAVYPGGWVAEGDCVLQRCACDLGDAECETLGNRAEVLAAITGEADGQGEG